MDIDWIKETNITKCGTNKQLITTTTPLEIYQYSDSMLNHLPEKALKKIQKHLLYSRKFVTYPANPVRRIYNSNDPDGITGSNIDDRVAKFANQLQSKFVYL